MLFRVGWLFIFQRLYWQLLVITLIKFILCLLDNIILWRQRLICIKYNRLRFLRQSIIEFLLLIFLFTLRRSPKRIGQIIRFDPQDFFEILYKPDPLSLGRIIKRLKLIWRLPMLLLLAVLATYKLFDAYFSIIENHRAKEVLLIINNSMRRGWSFNYLADSATRSNWVSHELKRSLIHDLLKLSMVGLIFSFLDELSPSSWIHLPR